MDPFCCLSFVFVCHTVLSIPSSLVATWFERAGLLALLFVMFSGVFFTFLYGVLVPGQVWYLIVWTPDRSLTFKLPLQPREYFCKLT